MAINLLSPGIEIREFELLNPTKAQNLRPAGAIVGVFASGPINTPVLVNNITKLEQNFGLPDGGNDETYFTARTFFSYSDRLWVVRVANNNPVNSYVKTKTEIDTIAIRNASGTFSNSDIINISGGTTYTTANVSVTTDVNGTPTALTLVSNGQFSSGDFPTSGDGLLNITAVNISNTATSITVDLTYKPLAVANQSSFKINNYKGVGPNGREIIDDKEWRTIITSNGYSTDTDLLWIARGTGNTMNGYRVSVCDSANAYEQNLNRLFVTSSANVIFVQGSKTANIVTANSAHATNVSASFAYRDGIVVELRPTVVGGTDGYVAPDMIITSKQVVGSNVMVTFETPWPRTTTFSILPISGRFTLSSTTRVMNMWRRWEFATTQNKAFNPPLPSDRSNTSPLRRVVGNTSYWVNDKVMTVVADQNNKLVYKSIGTRANTFHVPMDLRPQYGGYYHLNINNDINNNYMWWTNHRPGLSLNLPSLLAELNTLPYHGVFGSGTDVVDEDSISVESLMTGYNILKDKDKYEVDIFITGKAKGGTYGEGLINYIAEEVCAIRKDCIVVGSPRKEDIIESASNTIPEKLALFANAVVKSTYAIIDTGYKSMYDKYNDKIIDVPLNGDTAGLIARTSFNVGPWFSPAGYNRGMAPMVRTLVYNPSQNDRDKIYPNAINPYIQFRGKDAMLFGDKTTFNSGSMFDHINVRTLFLYLEKQISNVAKFTLFEFNDEFARAQFVGLVDPILRDVKGRRGIVDYRLICDETNNTSDVIDANGFIADIYIKPARSINYIQLNFVGTPTGSDFNEIIGKYDTASGRVQRIS